MRNRNLGFKDCAIIFLALIVSPLTTSSQTWSAKLISPGKYEVNITPPKIMEGVFVNITYFNAADGIIKTEDKPFTNKTVKSLSPGYTYAKSFTCDNSVARVAGNFIYYYNGGSGENWDAVGDRINEKSGSTIKSGSKIRLQSDPVQNPHATTWHGWQRAGGGSTDAALTTCEAYNVIYLFAKGTDDKVYVNVTTRNAPNSWRGWVIIPSLKTKTALASAIFAGIIYVFAKGDDNHCYYNYSAINSAGALTWQGWREVAGNASTDASLNASVFANYLYLFAKGNGEKRIYFNRLNTTNSWDGWKLVPGNFTTDMAVSSCMGPSTVGQRLWLFALSESFEIYYNRLSADNGIISWTGWNALPSGGITNKPLAVTGNSQELFLFLNGIYDRKMYLNTFSKNQSNRWSGWRRLEDTRISDVNVAVTGTTDSNLILFTRGIDDNRIYMNRRR